MKKHTCNWPGCKEKVMLKRWGCHEHWMRLPQRIRIALWASYCPGQDITMPSVFYNRAAQAAADFIKEWEKQHDRRHQKMVGAQKAKGGVREAAGGKHEDAARGG